MEKGNLCKTCWKMAQCVLKGIFECETCSEYQPMPLDDLLEQDEFIRSIMVGACPKCGSENTCDCETYPLAPVQDSTIGYCLGCGTYWYLECGYIFDTAKEGMQCPHWGICAECPQEERRLSDPPCPYRNNIAECPKIKELFGELPT